MGKKGDKRREDERRVVEIKMMTLSPAPTIGSSRYSVDIHSRVVWLRR